jgi:hypothetical protein
VGGESALLKSGMAMALKLSVLRYSATDSAASEASLAAAASAAAAAAAAAAAFSAAARSRSSCGVGRGVVRAGQEVTHGDCMRASITAATDDAAHELERAPRPPSPLRSCARGEQEPKPATAVAELEKSDEQQVVGMAHAAPPVGLLGAHPGGCIWHLVPVAQGAAA